MNERINHIVLRSSREDDFLWAWRNESSSHLKQHALLFDQIGILRLDNLRNVISSVINGESNNFDLIKPGFQAFFSDIEWLKENDIIFEPKIDDEFQKGISRILEENSAVTSELRFLNKAIKDKNKQNDPESKGFFDKNNSVKKTDGILLRIMSLVLEANKKISATTSLPYTEYTNELLNTNTSDVAQIVINKLPLPDYTTPWEQIVDYRNDTDNQKNLLALRRWIRKTSTQNLSVNEIEEELEWLINEFQHHMNLHKMKANAETLEVMVKAPLELIENLMKLKLSKIPEPLFALKKRQIYLLEAELNAPGREMSYIIKARDTFSNE